MKFNFYSLKDWFSEANGWKRIWIVSSVISLIYFVIAFPLAETNKGAVVRYEGLWAAEREMKNDLCLPYMKDSFDTLVEPKYSTDGSTCWHIFNHRRFSEHKSKITEALFQEEFSNNERSIWVKYILLGLVISTLLSLFAYLCGAIVSWVIDGFRKDSRRE
jgi:hypothetical protein